MKLDFKTVLINTILLIIPTVSITTNYLFYQRGEVLYEQGYLEGSEHTAELLKDISKLTPQQKKEIAVTWWTDTQDMVGARKALCGKPIQPKPKKE
jgi:hypothetical protein